MQKTANLPFDWYLWLLWMMATTLGWTISQLLLPGIGPVIAGFVIGVLQWLVIRDRIKNSWRWSVATGIGWAIGIGFVLFALPDEMSQFSGFLVGAATGIAQWLILRSEVLFSGWWILISVIAWSTGLSVLPGLLTTGTLPGVMMGLVIVLLLRNPKPAPNPQNILD